MPVNGTSGMPASSVSLSPRTAIRLGRMLKAYESTSPDEPASRPTLHSDNNETILRVAKNSATKWTKGSWRTLEAHDGFTAGSSGTDPSGAAIKIPIFNGLGDIDADAFVVAGLAVGGYIAIAAECGGTARAAFPSMLSPKT